MNGSDAGAIFKSQYPRFNIDPVPWLVLTAQRAHGEVALELKSRAMPQVYTIWFMISGYTI